METSVDSRKQKASDLESQARWNEAAEVFFEAALLSESCAERIKSLTNGAQMLINIGRAESAVSLLVAAVAASEDAGLNDVVARSNYHLGWAYSDLGRYDEAQDRLNRALQSEEMEWPTRHHLAKVDLEVGMLEEDEGLVRRAYEGFAEHNEHFGGNLAHGLRLMARSKAVLYVLTGDERTKKRSESLYRRTREAFEQKGNVYWPVELVEEEKMLLEQKDTVGLLKFQAFLRDKREDMIAQFKEISDDERLENMQSLVDKFRSL